ncbi:MAG: CDP-alcohol phosphatidyltransferase family protein [Actinomycetota bacterium]|nr:CDP-alcohol phosphatidyltransferase family protein [Rubrobacter sp.]MDQ3509205.1 CDP-alcohol phosphatidyltransferase family protein [Actinomycetota bacterium]
MPENPARLGIASTLPPPKPTTIIPTMLDEELRKSAKPLYAPLTAPLASRMSGNAVSLAGLAVGVLCLALVALGYNAFALVFWLANRLLDGLDGEVARIRGEASEFGSFLDIAADFFMYGGLLVALAIQHEDARLALAVLFLAYYLNGSLFLALSSVLERLKAERKTERGLHFRRSLTEGFETIMFGVLALALPAYISPIVWIFAAMVFISAIQRLLDARRML